MHNVLKFNFASYKNNNNQMNSSDSVTYVCLMDTHSHEVKDKKHQSKVLISRFALVLQLW